MEFAAFTYCVICRCRKIPLWLLMYLFSMPEVSSDQVADHQTLADSSFCSYDAPRPYYFAACRNATVPGNLDFTGEVHVNLGYFKYQTIKTCSICCEIWHSILVKERTYSRFPQLLKRCF